MPFSIPELRFPVYRNARQVTYSRCRTEYCELDNGPFVPDLSQVVHAQAPPSPCNVVRRGDLGGHDPRYRRDLPHRSPRRGSQRLRRQRTRPFDDRELDLLGQSADADDQLRLIDRDRQQRLQFQYQSNADAVDIKLGHLGLDAIHQLNDHHQLSDDYHLKDYHHYFDQLDDHSFLIHDHLGLVKQLHQREPFLFLFRLRPCAVDQHYGLPF